VQPLPGAVDAVLGWVVREAATNVLRHSGAGSVTVELTAGDDAAELTVTDDGRGPVSAAPDRSPGTGLAGLAERVEALGGRLETGAAPGRGFRLHASLPVTAQLPSARAGTP
jgi:two-component system sensor histidine kinase DesK